MEKNNHLILKEISNELFIALSVSFFVLLLLEIIKPDLVTAYISLNFWLFFWFLNGILVLVRQR